jgi:hypothetical protein
VLRLRYQGARFSVLLRVPPDELRVATYALDPGSFTIACECAHPACVETLEVDVEQYAQIRAQPTHFIVLSGHIYPEVERVIFEDARFQVVEKFGEAGPVAAASNGLAWRA